MSCWASWQTAGRRTGWDAFCWKSWLRKHLTVRFWARSQESSMNGFEFCCEDICSGTLTLMFRLRSDRVQPAVGSKKAKSKKKAAGAAPPNPVYVSSIKCITSALKLLTCEPLCATQTCLARCVPSIVSLLGSGSLLVRRSAHILLGAHVDTFVRAYRGVLGADCVCKTSEHFCCNAPAQVANSCSRQTLQNAK